MVESLPHIPDCHCDTCLELGDPQGPRWSQSKHVASSPQFPVSTFNIYSRVPKPGRVMFFVFYKPDKWFRFVPYIVHFAFYFLKKNSICIWDLSQLLYTYSWFIHFNFCIAFRLRNKPHSDWSVCFTAITILQDHPLACYSIHVWRCCPHLLGRLALMAASAWGPPVSLPQPGLGTGDVPSANPGLW